MPAHSSASRRKELAQRPERCALERLVQPVEPGVESPAGGTFGREPGLGPAAARFRARLLARRHRALDRIGQRPGRRRRVGVNERGRNQRRLAPAAVAVDDEQLRTGAVHQLRDRLGRGHRPEANDDLRPVGVDPRTRPSDVIGVGEDERPIVRAASQARERVGQDRIAGRGGKTGDRLVGGRVVERAGDDEAAIRGGQPPGDRVDLVGVQRSSPGHGGHERRRDGGRARAPSIGPSIAPRSSVGMSGSRRGRLRWTGPAGPSTAVATARPATDRTWAIVSWRLVHQGKLGEPLRVAAVEMVLVDRLRRAAIPQLRRPIRGENHERHPAQRRLHDGRREVDRGRAGGPEEDGGSPRRAGDAESEEPGRTLVDQDADSDAVVGAKRERQRRGAGTGTDDRVANPGPGQLLDERAQLARPAATALRLVSRAHGSAPALMARLPPGPGPPRLLAS